jgi:hypothetical protein
MQCALSTAQMGDIPGTTDLARIGRKAFWESLACRADILGSNGLSLLLDVLKRTLAMVSARHS